MNIGRNRKNICVAFSSVFIITTISYWVLAYIYHSQIYYLGIASFALLCLSLISIAYVLVVTAKRAIDREIERKEEELKRQNAEMNSEKK